MSSRRHKPSPVANGLAHTGPPAKDVTAMQMPKKAKKKAAGGVPKQSGGGFVSQHTHHNIHAPGVPSWLWPLMVNIIVLFVGVGATYGLMQGDIGNLRSQVSSLQATVTAQIVRIDGMVKEQDRITRLEERLGSITNLLTEIRTDLRDGRYAVRRDGVITSSPPGSNR